jgi:hypothetical protein
LFKSASRAGFRFEVKWRGMQRSGDYHHLFRIPTNDMKHKLNGLS